MLMTWWRLPMIGRVQGLGGSFAFLLPPL
jgi:hypothetical protein